LYSRPEIEIDRLVTIEAGRTDVYSEVYTEVIYCVVVDRGVCVGLRTSDTSVLIDNNVVVDVAVIGGRILVAVRVTISRLIPIWTNWSL
jgi:hypothetical protein